MQKGDPQPAPWFKDTPLLGQVVVFLALFVIAGLVMVLFHRLVRPGVRRLVKKSRWKWDDALVDSRTFRWLAHVPPALVIQLGSQTLETLKERSLLPARLPEPNVTALQILQNLAGAWIAVSLMMAVNAALNAANNVYSRTTNAHSRPIKGYIQIVKIFVFVLGTIAGLALLFGKDPLGFIAGIGAFTAVLLLIFKDTILSLVASVQLTQNDMVRIGDWIEVPSAGADGDVVDVALHTVKVQNWDKTISTVPTYSLISKSFKNWRGMSESGGRRIKRSLTIDMNSVRFLTKQDIQRFQSFAVLSDYITQKQQELAKASKSAAGDASVLANRRHLTNIGTFRAYMVHYLRSLPQTHGNMTFLVRQLAPTESGLPLEIYMFSNITAWVEYENIQADIFDHLLAILPEFDLRVFQRPAGRDLSELRTPH